MAEYTGRYNCTARLANGNLETISWYIYFYPSDGNLFLKCPLLDKLPRCMVFYRVQVPFRIPCKALHPDIKVLEQTINPHKFEYEAEIGFYGLLKNEVKEFECRGSYDGKEDFQRYELHRKTHTTKISVSASGGFEQISSGQGHYNLLVNKNQRLNLTCNATVGCNDIGYDIFFSTNSSDEYKVILNPPERTKCLVNFNEIAYFSKTITFEKVTANSTQVQCEIRFGADFKTTSANNLIFFAGN